MTLCDQLIAAETRLGSQAVPAGWLAQQPGLGAHGTIADLVAVVRTYTEPDRSDRAIRAVLALERKLEPDPCTILLIALAPLLLASVRGKGATPDDALAELTLVLCEPGDLADLADLDQLLGRLVHRAVRRWERHRHNLHDRRDRTVVVAPDDHAFHRGGHDDPATVATDRAALAAFRASVDGAIAAGAFTTTIWSNFAEGVLGPSLGYSSPRRLNIARARRTLARHIERRLAA